MLFNSIQFVLFLIVVLVTYNFLSQKGRLIFLLLASCFFYSCWNFKYLFLIAFTSVSSYAIALLIIDERFKKYKGTLLAICIIINLAILFFFKYFNFFNKIVGKVSTLAGFSYHFPILNFLLPVGISFYTFECFSYVIDVYRGSLKPEKNIFRFFLFVTYFPKLVAGPIVRSDHILPQLQVLKNFNTENFRRGLILILWGLFKKMVIADRLAISVNHVYNNVKDASALSLIIATIFFTYQIYCDFSGYSDIAIGVSKLFGIDLMENFKRPYFSKTVTEFWRRWHISLSSWFRDYLYIPLGGSRVSTGRWIFNSIFVFIVSGLWHGANYTFLIWGGIHGVMIVVEKFYYGKKMGTIKPGVTPANILRWATTYFIVMIGWVFFRANTLHDSFTITKKIVGFGNIATDIKAIFTQGGAEGLIGLNFFDFILAVLFPLVLVLINFKIRKTGLVNYICGQSTFKRWSFYLLTTFIIFWFGKMGVNQFIYFQF